MLLRYTLQDCCEQHRRQLGDVGGAGRVLQCSRATRGDARVCRDCASDSAGSARGQHWLFARLLCWGHLAAWVLFLWNSVQAGSTSRNMHLECCRHPPPSSTGCRGWAWIQKVEHKSHSSPQLPVRLPLVAEGVAAPQLQPKPRGRTEPRGLTEPTVLAGPRDQTGQTGLTEKRVLREVHLRCWECCADADQQAAARLDSRGENKV